MKKNELKEKSIEELSLELDKTKKTLKELQFKKVVSVVENPIQIRELRRQIARIKTYIHEKELQKIYSEIKGSEK
jgi:large subunit ribosomal protein L29